MLDSVSFYSREFALADCHKLTRTVTVNAGGEIVRQDGWGVPLGDEWKAHVIEKGTGGKVLFVDGSLPRLVRGTSLQEVCENDYENIVKVLSDRLEERGVKLPGDAFETSLSLSRVDFCRNLTVRYPIPSYLSAFSRYQLSRQKKSTWEAETLTWGNTRRELQLYDKLGKEIDKEQKSGMNLNRLAQLRVMPHNKLRVENRIKRASDVKKLLHLNRPARLADVFSSSLSRQVLVDQVGKLVRRNEEEPIGGYADVAQMLDMAGGKVRVLLRLMGSHNLLAQFGFDADRMLAFFVSCGVPRRTAYRHRSQVLRDCGSFVPQDEAVLVDEVRSKLKAVA